MRILFPVEEEEEGGGGDDDRGVEDRVGGGERILGISLGGGPRCSLHVLAPDSDRDAGRRRSPPRWRWLWRWRRIWRRSGRTNGCAAAFPSSSPSSRGVAPRRGGGERRPEDRGRRRATRSPPPMQSRRRWRTGSSGRLCGAAGIASTRALGRSSGGRRCLRGGGSPRAADRRRRRIAEGSGSPRVADRRGGRGPTTTTTMTATAMTSTAATKEHVHNERTKWRNRKKRCVSCCHHHCHCLNHC